MDPSLDLWELLVDAQETGAMVFVGQARDSIHSFYELCTKQCTARRTTSPNMFQIAMGDLSDLFDASGWNTIHGRYWNFVHIEGEQELQEHRTYINPRSRRVPQTVPALVAALETSELRNEYCQIKFVGLLDIDASSVNRADKIVAYSSAFVQHQLAEQLGSLPAEVFAKEIPLFTNRISDGIAVVSQVRQEESYSERMAKAVSHEARRYLLDKQRTSIIFSELDSKELIELHAYWLPGITRMLN